MAAAIYNVFVGSLLYHDVTVKTSGEVVTLKGVGKREWYVREIPKASITRKVKVSS